MHVVRINVSKFRGVADTSLTSCGALNVLIGKNNSGKSTILDAVDGFFQVISSRSIVADGEGPLRRQIDFHRGDDPVSPVKVSVDFGLTASELDEIIANIMSEAPQMKHALEKEADHLLRVEVTATTNPLPFAFVSKIALLDPEPSEIPESADRVLLAVSLEAGAEMRAQMDRLRRFERQALELIEIGRRIDSDDFQMLKNRDTHDKRGTAAMFVRRFLSARAELSYDIDSLFRRADSYVDFRSQIEAMADDAQSSAERMQAEPLKLPVRTFSGEAQVVPRYALEILRTVASVTVLHLRDRRDPVGKEEAQRLLALKTRRKGPEVLRNIQETVQSLLGVSIDAFESDRPSVRQGEVRAEMDVDEVLVEMNGAGIREALRLILDNELGSPQLLLVEEPEVHLHPALELSMLRYLKSASSRSQIFVTTHSTNFLDTAEMRNVYLTRRDPWVSVSILDYEQAETAIPDELGLRLSSIFMYDRLVFVEGTTDEAVLRELASLVGVNLGQGNVGFVVMGSVRNFTHYASSATIELLTRRRVKMSFILDRDEASESEVATLSARVKDVAQVHVLQKREIENYLAIPRVLSEFIREKRQLRDLHDDSITEEDVSEALLVCAEELKETTVQRRVARLMCAPVFLDRNAVLDSAYDDDFGSRVTSEIERQARALSARADEIEALIVRERSIVERSWSQRKLDVVPGDELIDSLCRKYDVRFKKRQDVARLARLLTRREIPSELSLLLSDLVS